MACIYCVTNLVNGKRYVGQTGTSAEGRWKGHCQGAARNGKQLIHHAIRKYGAQSFKVETLEKCEIEQLDQKEKFWIAELNSLSTQHGYNILQGGRGWTRSMRQNASSSYQGIGNPFYGRTHTPETKKRISDANSGRSCPPQTKEGISKKHKGIPKSLEQRTKMSKAANSYKKRIDQLDLDGNLLRTHDSIKDAIRWLKQNGAPAASKQYIRKCCAGKRKSGIAWKFRWSFSQPKT